MKSFRLFVAAVLGCACFTSCLEEFDVDIDSYSDYIVIDALITDCDSAHFVYISPLVTKVDTIAMPYVFYQDEVRLSKPKKTINGISVRVHDDTTGEDFAFEPIEKAVEKHNQNVRRMQALLDSLYAANGSYSLTDEQMALIDRKWEEYKRYFYSRICHVPNLTDEERLMLYSSNISFEGLTMGPYYTYYHDGCDFKRGHTYTLTVEAEGRTFTATQTINPVPKVDKVKFFTHDSPEGPLLSPSLYFNDVRPDRTDYYVFTDIFQHHRVRASAYFYVFLAPFSDENQSTSVNGLHMSLGMGATQNQKGDGYSAGNYYYYELFSISADNYDYYKTMEKQLTSDGGVYRPNPSTPLTNFSGEHVQGQFVAASKTFMYGQISPWDKE
ncbi:MAG: DUF4249 family protein [Bacteroidales bacterium]|nr:DUF4249 family protein [Bacteroidales bacterium]